MTTTPPPATFLSVLGVPIQAWSSWKKFVLWFLGVSNLEIKNRSVKKQILLSLLGVEGQRVVSTFHLDQVPAIDMLDKF